MPTCWHGNYFLHKWRHSEDVAYPYFPKFLLCVVKNGFAVLYARIAAYYFLISLKNSSVFNDFTVIKVNDTPVDETRICHYRFLDKNTPFLPHFPTCILYSLNLHVFLPCLAFPRPQPRFPFLILYIDDKITFSRPGTVQFFDLFLKLFYKKIPIRFFPPNHFAFTRM